MTEANGLKVGLAAGGGTGPELADVFRQSLRCFESLIGCPVRIVECEHVFSTYHVLNVEEVTASRAAAVAESEARAYVDFLLRLAGNGVGRLFRTAINAQSLYLAREELLCLKAEFLAKSDRDFIVIRDQAQGFYSGTNNSPGESLDKITRTCVFSKSVTRKILDYALELCDEKWGEPPDRIVFVYKFHLLDNRFASWVRDFEREKRLSIEIFQPDTMNRNLLRDDFRGRILVMASNEWADIVHVNLLDSFNLGPQENRCSLNVYLDERVRGLKEYQTVHGSADDIAGKGIVNPFATVRAAARIVDDITPGGEAGALPRPAIECVDEAIAWLCARNETTPDMGGVLSTREVLSRLLARLG